MKKAIENLLLSLMVCLLIMVLFTGCASSQQNPDKAQLTGSTGITNISYYQTGNFFNSENAKPLLSGSGEKIPGTITVHGDLIVESPVTQEILIESRDGSGKSDTERKDADSVQAENTNTTSPETQISK